ncbi:hypothetical protein [Streptomyces sp. 8N616]|uniref:hypothetical protein n=1 Tax=Streptomyces sp. 8N616 TaxID=3457414 RepID=UPI003FD320DC
MHRHRELCERAVDPLEIAAGLEAHGVTDRTAARFRHRDVFSLAEELYARVPRAEGHARVAPPQEAAVVARPRARRALLYLLPGTACAGTVAGVEPLAAGQAVRLGAGVAGAALVVVTLWLCLRRGPLSLRGASPGTAPLWTCWLLGHLLLGDALLARWAGRPHESPWSLPARPDAPLDAPLDAALHTAFHTALHAAHAALYAAPAAVALAFAVAPAAWCARWFTGCARRRLTASRGLEDFSAGIRPLVPTVVALFLAALVGLLVAARAGSALYPGGSSEGGSYGTAAAASAAALGTLLFVARLLAVHGRPSAAARGLAAACAVEAAALGTALAARLPGCGALGGPVEAVVEAYGPAAVPLAACTAAALALLAHATVTLSRAEAHTTPPVVPR